MSNGLGPQLRGCVCAGANRDLYDISSQMEACSVRKGMACEILSAPLELR